MYDIDIKYTHKDRTIAMYEKTLLEVKEYPSSMSKHITTEKRYKKDTNTAITVNKF